MALSTTRDGTITVGDMVRGALELVHVAEGGESLAAEDTTLALNTMRRMLRTWAAQGVRLWLNEQQTVTLAASTASYTLSPRTLEVHELGCFRRSGTEDTPIRVLDRQEYNRLPNKTASGDPFSIWADRQRAAVVVTVYPVPTASGDTLSLSTKRQIFDVTNLGEDAEFPPEWEEAIVWNLAKRLMPTFPGAPDPVTIRDTADELYATLSGQDRPASLRMRPKRR